MRQNLVRPPGLRVGDTIAVVAPAGPVPGARLRAGLTMLQSQFKVKFLRSPDLLEAGAEPPLAFLAGGDLQRAEEFNAALRDPDIRCIWAARGGFGSSRILEMLDRGALQRDPIPIVGFSDITALLCWAAVAGIQSIHGPVLTQLGELSAIDTDWMFRLLRDEVQRAPLATGLDLPDTQGRLLGGNLCLLAHLCGTPWAVNFADSLCVLEDVGERAYAIDRYLAQLFAQSGPGCLKAAAAVLLGDFWDCNDGLATAEAHLVGQGMSTSCGLPVGHGTRNRGWRFGGRACVAAGELRMVED